MLFVRTDRLKTGMRLARPIYNRDGVLLYERNSKLTTQGIQSIRAFGLIGLYILEPAEPVPPMTQEDILFERFQTMTVFSLQEELNKIREKKRGPKLQVIVNNILRRYGHQDKKINFVQNLRSREDYLYKHTLNVGILCALMTHVLNMKLEDQMDVIIAALVHDVGKLSVPKSVAEKDNPGEAEREVISSYEVAGYGLIDSVFSAEPNIKRICAQTQKALDDFKHNGTLGDSARLKYVTGSKVLIVAETFDTMTAMQLNKAPESEVTAIRYLIGNPQIFEPDIVDALIHSVNILVPGVSVELNTGDKAIVIRNNDDDIFRPVVLGFRDNNVMDLSNAEYSDIEVADIMKTMDNRYIFDTKTLKEHGIIVKEPEIAKMSKGTAEEEEEYVPGKFF